MSHYQLVGPAGWTHAAPELMVPHPDYFTTLLWRQVHAPNVLMRAHVHVYTHVHMNAHESVAQLVGDRVLNTTTRRGSAALQQSFQAGFWCAGATAPSSIARVRARVLCARVRASVLLCVYVRVRELPSRFRCE